MGAPLPLVVCSVGTDHHPFDRLVRWVDAWCASQMPGTVRCFVQVGSSARPTHAEAEELVPHAQLRALLAEAAVVVCHGGPGTIMDARDAGRRPVVVPRQRRLGEHVDDHQVVFSRRMAASGHVWLADEEAQLHRLLSGALQEPAEFLVPAESEGGREAVSRFGELVGELLLAPRRRRLLPLRGPE